MQNTLAVLSAKFQLKCGQEELKQILEILVDWHK
jgi:hypothetical protein